MTKFALIPLVALALVCPSAFAERIQIKNVAVVETLFDDASGASEEINRAEVREITNEIRLGAIRNLPRDRFNIMTTETVLSMGDAVLQDCAEENCVIALGSKIGADYIVRGTISKFRQTLTLTVELFDTEYGMLLAGASVRTENLDEMLEKTSAACEAMYKDFTDGLAKVAQMRAERKAAAKAADSIAAAEAAAKTADSIAAASAASQPPATAEAASSVTSKSSKEKKRSSPLTVTVRWTGAALAAGGLIGGIIYDGAAKDELDKYKTLSYGEAEASRKKVDDNISTRNILYMIGAAGACAFTVTLFF